MSKDFYKAVKERRTFYGIGKEKVVPEERIEEVIDEAITHCPTAFNSQSGRVVLLFNSNHDELWNMTKEVLKEVVPADQFADTEQKIDSFRNGYGTVLFFEDDEVTVSLQKEYPLYKDNFPVWAEQSNGMLQFIVWSSLEIEGLGASLQHYNPLIDKKVKENWDIPANWRLIGQMPFGKREAEPDDKEFQPIEERFKIYK